MSDLSPYDDDALPPALAALRAPAHPAELRGEEAAVAAFRAARLAAVPPPAARRARLIGRTLTVAVAGAVLAGGGLAVAAATGTLPGVAPATPAPDRSDPPAGVVRDHPVRPPQQPQPPYASPSGEPPSGPAGEGNGNGWGRGHGTGKPSKEPKPPKPSKPSKDKSPQSGKPVS